MTDPVRWGIIGPGRIAAGVAREITEVVTGGVVHAVGSRDAGRAQAFADRFAVPRAYGSYLGVLDDPDVDVVYVATPHRQHHATALAAIERGRHLLVEKAFTVTRAGAQEVADAARAAGTFCMEAMWTRFQPAVVQLRRLIADGVIGEVCSVHADLGLHRPFDAGDRLWDPAQGGGAILDLAVYPVSFGQMVLGGSPDQVQVTGTLGPGGVDADSTIVTRYGDRHAVASSSLLTRLPGSAAVYGTDGWIEVPPRFHHPSRVVVHRRDGDREAEPEVIEAPATGVGYSHEIDEVHRCLSAGRTESEVMPLADTVAVMGVLEAALSALGVSYTEDQYVF